MTEKIQIKAEKLPIGPTKEKEVAEKINKSLDYSIKDGNWWTVMTGFGESYLSPFAVFLKASALQISYLTSVPQLLSAILQLFAVKLTNVFKSRKRLVLLFAFLQGIIWLLIVLFSYFVKSVWVLIIFASLYLIFGNMGSPAWSSWMGDLVKEDIRGKYFGRRNRINGFFSFASIMAAGYILDQISSIDSFTAFACIFSVAFFGRMISCFYLSKQYEPKVEIREPKEYGFINFLKEIHKTNFGIFTLFSILMLMSVFIASPIFVLYWLKYLNFSYLQYMAIISAASITSFITMSYWGATADYYGNKIIILVNSKIIAILPLLWYFLMFVNRRYIFVLAIIIQIIGGFAWAGFNLSSSNLMYDLIKPINRIKLFSYFNVLKGIAIFIGSSIGGLVAMISINQPLWIRFFPIGLLFVMILSALARTIVALSFSNKIQEIKKVDHRPRFLYFVTIMPVEGLIFDSIVGMNRTVKKFKEKLLKIEKNLDYLEEDYKKKTKN